MQQLIRLLCLAAFLGVTSLWPTGPGRAAELTELKIALRPTKLATFNSLKHLPFLEYLEEHVGMPVKLRVGKDYETVIGDLNTGVVQVAFLGPFSYVLAREKTGGAVEPLAAGTRKSARRNAYNSIIVAGGRTKVMEPSQFNADHLFTVPDPASTSGYLLPFHRLVELGLDPKTTFKSIHIAGSHIATLLRVQKGDADGGASNMQTYNDLLKAGMIDIDSVRIIWRSPDLPEGPITVRKDLPGDIKYRLLKAFIAMPLNLGVYDYEGELIGFHPAFDRQYEVIRQIQRKIDRIAG